jgi:AraC-like DNA-binding protein
MRSLELDRQSAVFTHADPGPVSQYINEHVGPHRIAIRNRCRPDAWLRHRKMSELDICCIRYGNRVRVTSPALETLYHLQIVLHGHCQWTHAGHTQVLAPGDVLLINPDEVVDLVYSSTCDKFVIKIPKSLIQETAATQHLVTSQGELHFNSSSYRLSAMPGLIELLQLVCQEAGTNGVSDCVKSLYARAICAKILDHIPSNASPNEPVGDHLHFGKLVDFIDRHLGSSISVNSIHRRLTDSGALIGNITTVALDHGFTHLGRFSSHYYRQYGELPSATLKRDP